MNSTLAIIIGVLVAVGIGGLIAEGLRWRFAFWVMATPPFLVGMLGLIQGGIAEPFRGHQMLAFCSMMFCPIVGCALGSLRLRRRRRPESTAK
jgi:MFS family permease